MIDRRMLPLYRLESICQFQMLKLAFSGFQLCFDKANWLPGFNCIGAGHCTQQARAGNAVYRRGFFLHLAAALLIDCVSLIIASRNSETQGARLV